MSVREDFERDGFIVLPGFKSAESILQLRERAAKIVDELNPAFGIPVFPTRAESVSWNEEFIESGTGIACFFEEEAFDEDGRLGRPKELSINKIGHALHDRDPVFEIFSHDRRLQDIAVELGVARPLVYQSMYIFKQPRIGGEVRWHQDATYFQTHPISVTTFWFALERADRTNGCLWVQRGGHRSPLRESFVVHDGKAELVRVDATPWPALEDAEPIEVDAGTLVVFHGLLPHYSAPNRSASSRHAYTLHAVDGRAKYSKHNWLQRGGSFPAHDFLHSTDMAEPDATTFRFGRGGDEIIGERRVPAGTAKGAVIVVHGMAEHAARYSRFATELAAHGYAVYIPDLRGHGRTAGGDDRLGWTGEYGFDAMYYDISHLKWLIRKRHGYVRERHGFVPLFVFGHSMGSVLAQRLAQDGELSNLAGVILSGTFGGAPNLRAGIAVARMMRAIRGDRSPSPLQRVMFAAFNRPFSPKRTGFEWLSRDVAEVQKYADDPRCGFTFSNRLMEEMLRGYAETWKRDNERRIAPELPVLMLAGELDPVGAKTRSVTALAKRYRALGLRDVKVVFYPGARHEILNETNRDEVVRDVIAWLDEYSSPEKYLPQDWLRVQSRIPRSR